MLRLHALHKAADDAGAVGAADLRVAVGAQRRARLADEVSICDAVCMAARRSHKRAGSSAAYINSKSYACAGATHRPSFTHSNGSQHVSLMNWLSGTHIMPSRTHSGCPPIGPQQTLMFCFVLLPELPS